METPSEFVDYYELLKVNFDCDTRTLELAYHSFAKLYHPDNAETADAEKFGRIAAAYKILRNSDSRAEYNRNYFAVFGKPQDAALPNGGAAIDEKTAIGDGQIHAQILLQLYKKRRERASDPGVATWLLQDAFGCSDDQFEFHVWYLKAKGLLEVTEQGTLAITISGVDHVISTSRQTEKEKLLIAHSEIPPDP